MNFIAQMSEMVHYSIR